MSSLERPPGWNRAKSVEVMRCWLVDGERLRCTFRTGAWSDLATWGMVLADTIDRLAEALSETTGKSKAEISELVFDMLEREMERPPDSPRIIDAFFRVRPMDLV